MNRKQLFTLVMMVLAIATLSVPAVAGSMPGTDSITLTLSSPPVFGGQGELLSFFATVSAPIGNSGPLFLNGDAFTVGSPLTLDDSPFILNFPLTLQPGGNASGLLFTILIPPGTPAGVYDGFFQILGGSDGSAQDPISNVAEFQFDVPEPDSLLLLLGSGAIALVGLARRRLLLP